MKISILRCELNTEQPPWEPHGHGYVYGHDEYNRFISMKHFYRVFIDDRQIAEKAFPFSASDPYISLDTDPHIPYYGDGYRWVSAWRVGNYVLWSNPLPDDPFSYSTGLPPGKLCAFEFDQYRKAADECFTRNIVAVAKGQKKRRKKRPKLPPLQGWELSAILEAMLPDDEAPIYTTPEIQSDPRGHRLLRIVRRCLVDTPLQDITIADMPEKWVEIRIGLDMEGFPECVWRVGETRNGLAVWFVSRPTFPLWLCGEPVDRAFGPVLSCDE